MGEFFEPFFGVSMIYDAFIDVLPREGITSFGVGRGGVTQSGAKVYKDADSKMMSVEKGFLHVLNTLKPNILPIRIRSVQKMPNRGEERKPKRKRGRG